MLCGIESIANILKIWIEKVAESLKTKWDLREEASNGSDFCIKEFQINSYEYKLTAELFLYMLRKPMILSKNLKNCKP